jgi:hypothetical protein
MAKLAKRKRGVYVGDVGPELEEEARQLGLSVSLVARARLRASYEKQEFVSPLPEPHSVSRSPRPQRTAARPCRRSLRSRFPRPFPRPKSA